ncbi:MAG: mandelate racemase/muconate lactonizing enzyme family protein [Phycisphaerales bacterium]|nr:mandelate racemase/muconate lactonizing enzyme family protein [Phycisphaerales bacterium]
MKITRIDCHQVVVPAHPGRVNSPEYGPAIFDLPPKIILEIHTDDGLVGLGESPREIDESAHRAPLAKLIGQDLSLLNFQEPPLADLSNNDLFAHPNQSRPHRLLEQSFNVYSHLAIHTALLDLLGKKTNLPLSALLGGAYRYRVPVDTWMGRMTPEDSARICAQAKRDGFAGAKMKCALEDDNVGRAAAIRDACGADFKLTFDPNSRFYRYGEAAGMLKRLADVGNIGCVEDPFNKSDLEGYRLLRAHGLFPLAIHAGYNALLMDAIKTEACDLFNLGGTPWDVRKAADICWLANLPSWHGSGVDLGITEAMCLHVAASCKSMSRPSDMFGRTIRQHNLITNPLTPQNGAIPLPTGPGLGVELDRDALDNHTIKQFTLCESDFPRPRG